MSRSSFAAWGAGVGAWEVREKLRAIPEMLSAIPKSARRRHLCGLGFLLLTILPAYWASRVSARQAADDVASLSTITDDSSARIEAHIQRAAVHYGVSPVLIAAIVEAESEFNPRAVSRRGARGLMQLMPATASSLDVEDSFDPYENIDAGVRHLRRLAIRFNGNLPLVLAAYNAGERAVIKYHGIPPYPETRRYVRRILRRVGYQGPINWRPAQRHLVVRAATNVKPVEVRHAWLTKEISAIEPFAFRVSARDETP